MLDWSTACPDWEARIVARQSLIPFAPLYQSEADYALDVFKSLKVVDLPGNPTFGECSEQWVFDFVAAVFGSNDPETGKQHITEFLLLISKKNTKSTIAAGIMLTALIIGWREEEELLILAPTIEVASNSYKPAAAMVRADPELSELFHVQDHTRTITHRKLRSALKVVAAETDTVSGKKAGRILIDELWVFGKRPKSDAMFREATGGQMSRPEGFTIYLTTQSDEAPAGVLKSKLDYARDVRDGKIEDRQFLPVLYEFPEYLIEQEAYLNPDFFYVTNPNMGRSVDADKLARELTKELQAGPETRNVFLAKHLNVEIGLKLRANRWAGADFWERRADPAITFEAILERCEVAAIGIDGGGLDDLFGFSLIGRERETRDWLAWHHAWCHEGVLTRRKSIASKLRDFEKQGDLTIVSDELQDVSQICGRVLEVLQAGILASVSVDPNGLGELVEELAEIGVTQEDGLLVGAAQGIWMMNAIKTAERKLANGTLRHSGASMMDWCIGNLKIEPTATAIRATKANAGDAKIDPAMAMFDAVQVMSKNPEPKADDQNMNGFFASLRST